MLLTFVTVNKNSGILFKRTEESICKFLRKNQNNSWLIIDSNSEDQSGNCIQNILEQKGDLPIDIVRGKDNGIYHAMNKAIKICNSKYILFVNSGDTINELDLLNTLKSTKNIKNQSIVCGYIISGRGKLLNNWIKKTIVNVEILLKLRLPSSHNSILYLNRILKRFYFNEKYKYAADYNQYLEMLNHDQKFLNKKNFKVINISNDGYIAKRRKESYEDCIRINFDKRRIIGIIYWKIKLIILKLITS